MKSSIVVCAQPHRAISMALSIELASDSINQSFSHSDTPQEFW